MSETQTLTLTEFLLARIEEDEHDIRHEMARGEQLAFGAFEPAKLLAECEAKRGIVEECQMLIDSFGDWDATPGALPIWSGVSRRERSQAHGRLRALALPYADHPDYRPEWAP